jgi:hypothetical protein
MFAVLVAPLCAELTCQRNPETPRLWRLEGTRTIV